MIHLRAIYWQKGENDIRFVNKLARMLGDVSKTCDCKYFYKRWVEENPPDFDNYFKWTVNLHNAVNEKLGKKTISLPSAKSYWVNHITHDH